MFADGASHSKENCFAEHQSADLIALSLAADEMKYRRFPP